MSFKNYVYLLTIGLICVWISTTQPSYVQASQTAPNEIEQTFSNEEDKYIDSPVSNEEFNQPNQQPESSEVKATAEESETPPQSSLTEDGEIKIPEEKKASEKNEQDDLSNIQSQLKTSKSNKTSSVRSNRVRKKTKTHYLSLSKIFNRLISVLKLPINKGLQAKGTVWEHLSSHHIFNKNTREQITIQKRYLTTLDFAPYYFIYPGTQKNYLEKIVFPDKITNPKELLPYSYTIQATEVKIEARKNIITPQGTTDFWVLANAPSPKIEITGDSRFAKLVIDIRNNTLYKYDKRGFPLKAYLVATGARGTRTMPGVRIVTYKERFPYEGAPNSKRALDPYSYGPNIIFWNQIEPKTGRQYGVEQLLHGNGNEYSIGRKVSHGCIRTNNNVMRNELSKEVKRGDYILLMNPDIN